MWYTFILMEDFQVKLSLRGDTFAQSVLGTRSNGVKTDSQDIHCEDILVYVLYTLCTTY